MAAIDDANAALAQLNTDVQALIAKQGGTSDAQIQQLTQNIQALDAQVKTAIGG